MRPKRAASSTKSTDETLEATKDETLKHLATLKNRIIQYIHRMSWDDGSEKIKENAGSPEGDGKDIKM